MWTIHHADCLEYLRQMPDESIDAVVTDPPYGLSEHKPAEVAACLAAWIAGEPYVPKGRGFMGRAWDAWVPGPEVWREALRVLKPGGHALIFAGSRTQDLMGMAVRLAGFEMRDTLQWLYGSGFPKSLDVSKAMTKNADARTVRTIKLWLSAAFDACGKSKAQINRECGFNASDYLKTEAGNDAGGRATWHMLLPYGEKWARIKSVVGFGPEFDDEIECYGRVVSRRRAPKESRGIYGEFSGNVSDYDLTDAARQWSGWGTALKPAYEPIILARKPLRGTVASNVQTFGTGAINVDGCRVAHASADDLATSQAKNPGRLDTVSSGVYGGGRPQQHVNASGRWPANILLDEAAAAVLDAQAPNVGAAAPVRGDEASAASTGQVTGERARVPGAFHGDSGGASRFFYVAKASPAERDAGLRGEDGERANVHPTVKPVALMRWLARLITPPGGVVLDPFTGSGTTGVACMAEGFRFVGIEAHAEYVEIARARVAHAAPLPPPSPTPATPDAPAGAPSQLCLFA